MFDVTKFESAQSAFRLGNIDLYAGIVSRNKSFIKECLKTFDLQDVIDILADAIKDQAIQGEQGQHAAFVLFVFKQIKVIKFHNDQERYKKDFLVPNIGKFAKVAFVSEEMTKIFHLDIYSVEKVVQGSFAEALGKFSAVSTKYPQYKLPADMLDAMMEFNKSICQGSSLAAKALLDASAKIIGVIHSQIAKPTTSSLEAQLSDRKAIESRLYEIKAMPPSADKIALIPQMSELAAKLKELKTFELETVILTRQFEEAMLSELVLRLRSIFDIYSDFGNDELIETIVAYYTTYGKIEERNTFCEDIISLCIDEYDKKIHEGLVFPGRYLESAAAIVIKYNLPFSDIILKLHNRQKACFDGKDEMYKIEPCPDSDYDAFSIGREERFFENFEFNPPKTIEGQGTEILDEALDNHALVDEGDVVSISSTPTGRASALTPISLESKKIKWVINGKEYIVGDNAYEMTNCSGSYISLHEDLISGLDKIKAKQFQSILDNGPCSLSPRSRGANGVKFLGNVVEFKLTKCDLRPFTQLVYIDDEGNKLYIFDRVGNHATIKRLASKSKELIQIKIDSLTMDDTGFENLTWECPAASAAAAPDEKLLVGAIPKEDGEF